MPFDPSEDVILPWLAGNECATAVEVGRASGMALPEVRGALRRLERRRLVTGRPSASFPSHRVYTVTHEGRLKVGISGSRVRESTPSK